MTAEALLYPGLILILALFLLLTIPRPALRTLLPYGVVLGGLIDFLCCLLFDKIFGVFSFQNLGMFGASGVSLFSVLAWVLVMVIHLYFYPKDNKHLGYFYTLAFALFATGFSQVVASAGMFSYASWFYPLPMFLAFLARFALATWLVQHWKVDC